MMLCRAWRKVIMTLFFPLACLAFAASAQAVAAESPTSSGLVVGSGTGQTLTLSMADVAKLPRTALRVKEPHSETMATYEGVLLFELLQKAGVRFADPSTPETAERKLPGSLRTSYVLIEAADGYQVVYSVAELHPDLGGRQLLLADSKNGQPLDAKASPYQVIAAASELHGRWIRQVTRILVQPAVRPAGEQQSPASESLVIENEAGKSLRLTPAEFAKLPRTTIHDKIPPHEDLTAGYEGVLLHELLGNAGVQFLDPAGAATGEKRIPAALRTAYVLIEAADGYQVVFSIPEIHPDLGGSRVLVVDRVDGQPLEEDSRPYRIIIANSKLYEVWIRQVTRILVRSATKPTNPTARPGTSGSMPGPGRLYLVGTGPGDPELITLKAASVLRTADSVFCFSWLKEELTRFVEPGRVQVVSPLLMGGRYLGQKPEEVPAELRDGALQATAEHAKFKQQVEQLVAQGKKVAFADNGDPTVFSPWSWATQEFAQLQPGVIPGISSFNAANAALKQGVSGSGSITLTSGNNANTIDKDGRLSDTLVFFTHQSKMDEILPSLQARFPADTPVAIVCDVSYPTERIIRGTLGEIRTAIGDQKLPQLYLFYVGDGLKQSGCCPLPQ